jgi:hypothetical protein
MPIFSNGDRVLLRNEKAGKLDCLWEGLYTICEVDPGGYRVRLQITFHGVG